jgi:teichuronic acid exporter
LDDGVSGVPTNPDSARDEVSIGQRVVTSVSWSTGIKVGFQLVNWAMTLLVIRILTPDDYGLMAISQIFINVMVGFANLGLGDALVQRQDTPRPVIASVFGLLILMSSVLTVSLFGAAYPIAEWYHDPRLVPLIQVSSLGFLFNALTTLPRAYLTKSLRIRPMFIMEMSSGLIASVAIVVLAYTGHGVWSLLIGWLVRSIVQLIGFAILAAEYYTWPSLDLRLVRPLLSYSTFRTLEALAFVVFTSADLLIIGLWLNPADLGRYTVARNFAGMPLNKIAPIINSVAFPAFAMIQGQPAAARYYALKAMRLMASVSVPVFFGIAAIAPEIVDIVFGGKWRGAEPMLAVLALATIFRAILLVIPNYLQGIGDARAGFWCTATGVVIFPPAFIIGCHWGAIGVCYAWLLGSPIVYVINALIASWFGRLDFKVLLMTPLRARF